MSTARSASNASVSSVARLAEADHERALRVDRVADLGGHRLGPLEDVQRCDPSGRACGPASGAARTVSRLWLRMSGRASITVRSGVVLAVEVGDEDLDAHARDSRAQLRGSSRRRCARRRRAGRRGRRSSRRRARGPGRATASATRRGSSSSNQVGRPVLTSQKPQARVQVSPRIMIVAVRWSQHSPMFGQWASSQTVLRFRPRSSRLRSW